MSQESVSPEWLAKECEKLRLKALFADEEENGCPLTSLPPQAQEYLLLALTALEQAQRFAKLAEYNRMRGD